MRCTNVRFRDRIYGCSEVGFQTSVDDPVSSRLAERTVSGDMSEIAWAVRKAGSFAIRIMSSIGSPHVISKDSMADALGALRYWLDTGLVVSREYQPPTGLQKLVSPSIDMPLANCIAYRVLAVVLNCELIAIQKPPRVDGEAVAQ